MTGHEKYQIKGNQLTFSVGSVYNQLTQLVVSSMFIHVTGACPWKDVAMSSDLGDEPSLELLLTGISSDTISDINMRQVRHSIPIQ
jgi:hypothetical protein